MLSSNCVSVLSFSSFCKKAIILSAVKRLCTYAGSLCEIYVATMAIMLPVSNALINKVKSNCLCLKAILCFLRVGVVCVNKNGDFVHAEVGIGL